MFRRIARLLFGGEEETPDEAKPGEPAEDGWLVVNHQEAGGCESQDAEPPLDSASQGDTAANAENNSPSLVEASAPPSISAASYVSQPKALAEQTRVIRAQRAKAWTDRHGASRNAIQRQNQVRQANQHNSFHLQQPSHRSLSY